MPSPAADGPGGVLLLYHRPPSFVLDAANVTENIDAFPRNSRFPVWTVNTAPGFPPRLSSLRFDAVVLHYSVFASGPWPYFLDEGFLDLLARKGLYKIAFFQDEHHWCRKRFDFLNAHEVDCVYTMLEDEHVPDVYGAQTRVPKVVSHLPGYVGPDLLEAAGRFAGSAAERSIDVGYRGRPVPTYMGRGAMEKREIGERFAERAAGSGLALDIRVLEEERLYGDEWYRFMVASKATLGVESGVSCFDLEDEVRADYERLGAELGREPTVSELEASGPLARWDGRIPYRTISPRHFEAAALGVTQILYEGHYSGAMEPMRHYLPLRKDFSNFDEVLERFRDPDLRRELEANARHDLVDSGAYSYERFVEGFDETLAEAGLRPPAEAPSAELVRRATRRRPLRPATVHYVNGAWHWLSRNHPRFWRALHLASRPVVVPVRALIGLGRGGGSGQPGDSVR